MPTENRGPRKNYHQTQVYKGLLLSSEKGSEETCVLFNDVSICCQFHREKSFLIKGRKETLDTLSSETVVMCCVVNKSGCRYQMHFPAALKAKVLTFDISLWSERTSRVSTFIFV